MTPLTHWADGFSTGSRAPDLVKRVHEVITEQLEGKRQVVTLRDVEGLTSVAPRHGAYLEGCALGRAVADPGQARRSGHKAPAPHHPFAPELGQACGAGAPKAPDYSFPEHLERTQVLLMPMLGVGAREDGPP